ncbi:hypothetical protein DQ384_05820 [Sphaerisporangium album]|uniref:Uncharacterized protein n=1 Tax=Sphaerisporangium album TaxID=509200 RepID=A0A367FNT7_9ACTN|nr:hypothetical protein DQ384_05820 [Sphaerisporangium album]
MADELYAGAPEDFVETRKRLAAEAKKGGDAALAKRIAALRRPTVSAWAANQLARSAPDEVDRLLDLGDELRAAWTSGGRIGDLDRRRGELVSGLLRRAQALADEAGRPLREPAVREVEDTLHAATMDPDVAEEVRTGRLAQPRSYAGFAPAVGFPEPAEPTPAPAGTPEPELATVAEPSRKAPAGKRARDEHEREKREGEEREKREREEKRRREEDERRRRVAERIAAAEQEARDADRALAEWESEAREADEARTAAGEEVDRLRDELAAALHRQEIAGKRLTMAERERDKAARRATKAHQNARTVRENP